MTEEEIIMKKLVSGLLCAALILTALLTGCGETTVQNPDPGTAEVSEINPGVLPAEEETEEPS